MATTLSPQVSSEPQPTGRGSSVTTRVPPPVEGTWFWYVMWGIVWFARLTSAKLTVIGREHIPMKGGSVVTCNHLGGFDYAALGYSSPRQVFFMVKAEAFRNPILAWVLTNGGGIPVQRGKADTQAVQRAIDKVQSGYPLAIFPEGTRSKDGTLQAAHTGVVRIAMHAKVPVVPAVALGGEKVLSNLFRFWKRVPVTVQFGEPIDVNGDPTDRRQVVEQTKRVMLAMAAMLPPERRGVWADGKGKVYASSRSQAGAGAEVGEKASPAEEGGAGRDSTADAGSGVVQSAVSEVELQENDVLNKGDAAHEEVEHVRK